MELFWSLIWIWNQVTGPPSRTGRWRKLCKCFTFLTEHPLPPLPCLILEKRLKSLRGKFGVYLKIIWRALLVCCESWFPLLGRNCPVLLPLLRQGRGSRGKSLKELDWDSLSLGHTRLRALNHSWDTCWGAVVGWPLWCWQEKRLVTFSPVLLDFVGSENMWVFSGAWSGHV